jgi:hypothetical protein
LASELPAGLSFDCGGRVCATASDTVTLVENGELAAPRDDGAFQWQIAGVTCDRIEPARRPARNQSVPLVLRTFELRLRDAEEQQEIWDLSADLPTRIVVAANKVKAYVTRSGESDLAVSEIGGIEVAVELVDDSLCCTVGLSDFRKGELVVVQVDVAIHAGKR